MLRFFAALVFLLCAGPAMATEAGWALLREGGHVVLMRHAMSGGGAEPANFDIEKCATQRNLSERGKQQARKIGALFAARAAPVERILSSRWCRCLDTARIAFDAKPEIFEALDPPKADEAQKAAQLKAVVDTIAGFAGSDNLVMVTHAEDILALTGVSAREGEAVIVRPDGERLHVLARIVFN
ncbi:histidine phosphatase family protein [Mesorhizobium sp. LHD-90]|uniref:histidine phosphatase family protein n=1 Tax=Mesorhizobium sp. LHD-90 TaxID=3071414 RepID=UPI0027E18184|nr:histidine phosphatase family protein [Mesorhizobium sp. LHD-90]MDQ6433153.1 histidine phosphatase family protein [Mesorhizobium sp. LHD-90]